MSRLWDMGGVKATFPGHLSRRYFAMLATMFPITGSLKYFP